jgi:peptide/nickel transport system substrate-binding protein
MEVSVDAGPLSLGGRKQRTLLAVLLARANEVVSRDELIDAVWAGQPPPSAGDSLDAYLHRLRKLLGPDRLIRQTGGYLLQVDPGELDATQFQQLIAAADRAADAGVVGSALSEALALWRGPAWADIPDALTVRVEAQRLDELRLSALESRIEADLALGGGAELVAELERLVEEHPLRERLLGALMLALYRAGRQADALETFQTARRRLDDELGLEPGPELQDLQLRILRHDRTLAAPRRFPSVTDSRCGRIFAVAALLVVAAALAGGLVLNAGASNRQPALAAGVGGVVAVRIGSDRIALATQLAGTPGSVTAGGGSAWVANPGTQEVSRIDTGSGVVVDRIHIGAEPGSIVYGGGAIWVSGTDVADVTRIDPTSDIVTQTIQLHGATPVAIAYGAAGLWVADSGDKELLEIDPNSDSLKRALSLDLQPSAVLIRGGAVWVTGYNDATLEQIDPETGRVIGRVHVGNGPVSVAYAAGSLWVANSLDSTVSRIDPATRKVTATIAVGSGPDAVAAGPGAVWVANQYSGTVSRIDPRRNRVAASVKVGGAPSSLAVNRGRLWVGVSASAGSHRGGKLVIVTPIRLTSSQDPARSIDPALYQSAGNGQFTGLAYDSLVSFQQSPGPAGLRLVPDLALSIPAAVDRGKAYMFRIRPGIRYSDGQFLRAIDFRRGFERLFRVGSPGTSLFTDVVGARACLREPRTCNLSQGIATNNTTGAVTFRLTAPDPDFLFKLTEFGFSAPIPPGTPDHETGQQFVPGTGPYEITSVGATEVGFSRNPFFHEWSHAAQPDGNPDSIVWRTTPTNEDAITAIEQGRADWLYSAITGPAYHKLELQSPAQLHPNPQPVVDFAAVNTNTAPFNDVRVRQALNYAINRAEIVKLYGGPRLATPICQPIAPGLPGYRRYCPYTLHPDANGTWSAPNLTRARHLVAESGTRGERIVIWGSPDIDFVSPAIPQYFASVLRTLGYRVRLHLAPEVTITNREWARMQIYVDGDWLAPWPDPSSYVPQFFGCGGGNGNGWYCNRAIDRQMRRAELLELTDPLKSRTIWEAVDRRLTNTAEWVPTVTHSDIELTSRRLRNYQYSPVGGFLADQSWLGQPTPRRTSPKAA